MALVVALLVCLRLFAARKEALLPYAAPDGMWWYGPDELRTTLGAFSMAQRTLYARSELTTDLVFPAAYGMLFAILLARLYPRSPRVIAIPILAAVADLVENSINVYLVWRYPDGWWTLAYIAGIGSAVSWGGASASAVLVIVGAVLALVRRRRAA